MIVEKLHEAVITAYVYYTNLVVTQKCNPGITYVLQIFFEIYDKHGFLLIKCY